MFLLADTTARGTAPRKGSPGGAPGQRPGTRHVDVWRFAPQWLESLDVLGTQWLDDAERARAERIAGARRRQLFVRVRHAVRAALAGYVGLDPAQLRFEHGPHGKPRLARAGGVEFSLSHAGGAAVLAVTTDALVGIDLERVRSRPRDDLARRMLSGAARAVFDALPLDLRDAAFAWAWAEREAYTKALGLGIGDGWDLAARLFADLPLAVEEPAGYARPVAGWVLTHLHVWPAFACVLCTPQAPTAVQFLDPSAAPPWPP